MSLTSSLFAGVSGLNSQGAVLGVLGDNISNISTVGFKAGETTFSSLVTGDFAAGGVGSGASSSTRVAIDQQGIIQSTGIATDIAISGQGFFVVTDDPDVAVTQREFFYTRAGSFRQDNTGNFVNAAGFALQAYPLDNDGNLPGDGNNTNTNNKQLLESLETVNTRSISSNAFATSSLSLGLNLDASESILTGAGDAGEPISTSINNNASSTDILAPTANVVENDTLTVTLGGTSSAVHTFIYGGFAQTDGVAAGILGSTTASGKFSIDATVGNTKLADGDSFTITSVTEAEGSVVSTFTFNNASASSSAGTFNSLETLAAAIDKSSELTATIVNGSLLVSATDARGSITFADVSPSTMVSANAFDPVGLTNFADVTSVTTNRWNSLAGLETLVDNQTTNELSATIRSPGSDAKIEINVNDPLATVTFANGGANAGTSLLVEYGLDGTTFDPIYDPAAASGDNMASGKIPAAFTRNVRIFDAKGDGHDVRISFAKASNQKWLVEVYAADPSEIAVSGSFKNGQLATGSIEFGGDGTLASVDAGLTASFTPTWTNGADALPITLDFGTLDLADGLSNFSGGYNVQFAEQNGAASGQLSSVEINSDGYVIANFTNGQSRSVFQIPLASFPNVNGLNPQAGNVFAASDGSGEFSLNVSGDSGVGVLSNQALEGANVELADELTKIIVAQRAFQANTKIITTADELLEELNRI